MNKAIISLSFDDARQDNENVFNNILAPKNIPATINVTTGYVDGTIPDINRPCNKAAMSVSDVISIASNPLFEAALHGDFHLNTTEDIQAGDIKLKKWIGIPKNEILGFASPGSGMPIKQFIESEQEFIKNGILYMRTDLRLERYSRLRIFSRKVSRILHFTPFYRFAFADTIMNTCPDRVIYSVPILKNTSLRQLKSLIDLCIKRRGALTITFHSITDDVKREDKWSWSTSNMKALCDYLQEKRNDGKLDILTTKNLYNKIRS